MIVAVPLNQEALPRLPPTAVPTLLHYAGTPDAIFFSFLFSFCSSEIVAFLSSAMLLLCSVGGG
jgi:hypothetical protein